MTTLTDSKLTNMDTTNEFESTMVAKETDPVLDSKVDAPTDASTVSTSSHHSEDMSENRRMRHQEKLKGKPIKNPPHSRRRLPSKIRMHKKPSDMPRRPLSAYNLFFRDQRTKLLQDRGAWCKPKVRADDPGLFAQLGKKISEEWKKVKPEDLQRYKDQARTESLRYKREMEEYTQTVAASAAKGKPVEQRKRGKGKEPRKQPKGQSVTMSEAAEPTRAPVPTTTEVDDDVNQERIPAGEDGYFVITPVLAPPTVATIPSFSQQFLPSLVNRSTLLSGPSLLPMLHGPAPALVANNLDQVQLQETLNRLALFQQEQQQQLRLAQLQQQLLALQSGLSPTSATSLFQQQQQQLQQQQQQFLLSLSNPIQAPTSSTDRSSTNPFSQQYSLFNNP